jgi:hypothetical protein
MVMVMIGEYVYGNWHSLMYSNCTGQTEEDHEKPMGWWGKLISELSPEHETEAK